MNTIILIVLLLLCIITALLNWYRPKIEIVVLEKGFNIYLWYNKWYGPYDIRRTFIRLF